MNRKVLFFDIDGTLVSFKTHQIPKSAVDALRQVHDRGHRIVISTGRAFQIIDNLSQIADLIDGYITVNGAHCFAGNTVVLDRPIPEDEVRTFISISDEQQFAIMLVGEHEMAVHNVSDEMRHVYLDILRISKFPEFIPLEQMSPQKIYEFNAFVSKEKQEKFMSALPHCVSFRWYPTFSDINEKNANKGAGVIAMAEHFGVDIADTIAFGDGNNDVPMIRQAGTGIAMGNAWDSTKQVADLVTDSVDEDGIRNALVKLQLL
ncbi:MAG: Cof-type HAD-IIB family hydrolase [Succinivibrio sp.]|nr:Cof-type HAD-IIB family hydrolase [Succinivibrio sp.]